MWSKNTVTKSTVGIIVKNIVKILVKKYSDNYDEKKVKIMVQNYGRWVLR